MADMSGRRAVEGCWACGGSGKNDETKETCACIETPIYTNQSDNSPGAVCAELFTCNADAHSVRCPKAVATVTIEQIVANIEHDQPFFGHCSCGFTTGDREELAKHVEHLVTKAMPSRTPLQARKLISSWRDLIYRAEKSIAEIEREYREAGLCLETDLHRLKGNGCLLCGYGCLSLFHEAGNDGVSG